MIFAWFGALAIGLSLGLLGSGGSILTVPVLVYLVGQTDKVAIAGSLAIVGGISLIGAVPYAIGRRVDWRSVLLFGVPGMAGTYLGAFLAVYVSGAFQLLLFAVIMLLAAVMMLRPSPADTHVASTDILPADVPPTEAAALKTTEEVTDRAATDPKEIPAETTAARPKKQAVWKVGIEGLLVGVVTGLVGVGGGFLIVPALVLLGGLSMHMAVGTSLVIIALKSFSGFYKYTDVLAELGLGLDWNIILVVTGLGVVGSFAGNLIGSRIPQAALRRGFAVFLVVMGTFILWQNLPGAFADHSPRELLAQIGFANDTITLGPVAVPQAVLHVLVSVVVFLALDMVLARGPALHRWGWSVVAIFVVVGRLVDVIADPAAYTGQPLNVLLVGQGGFAVVWALAAVFFYSVWYFDTRSDSIRRAVVPTLVAAGLWLGLAGLQALAHGG
ncbi:MAG: sulfite exporter TauE/SafE family protein [Trueperaceae bacterium]|nr:sulfite exporter TauE/SafE family protein [Trueperaceae bacterium]